MSRANTRVVKIGDRVIGGGNPILIQSMTNTKTEDVEATVKQIQALTEAGCDIIRCAVPTMEAAKALSEIKKQISIPLVADIHFDYRLAIAAIENGADKIRINPGNIGSRDRIQAVVDAAKERQIPIRVGVNSGSLEKELVEKYNGVTAEGLVESALDKVRIIEEMGYDNLVISIKSSDVMMCAKAHELITNQTDHQLHVGITEAGTLYSGNIKSAVGLGIILYQGIGDTIRVYKANMIIPQIAENLTGSGNAPIPHSCPACGRDTMIRKDNEVESLFCVNPDCPAKKIKSFALFTSRDAMNIDGLSEATLEKFIARGFIHDFGDIFEISRYKEEIVEMEGFGQKSYDNLIDSLEQAKDTTLPRVIYSLGIANIGLANAKVICRHFDNDLEKIRHAELEEVSDIDTIGPVIAGNLVEYFKDEDNNRRLDHLMSFLHIQEEGPKEEQIFAGMNFVITGSLVRFGNRSEAKELIESLGGKVTGSVTKKTNYLINNDVQSNSSKNKKARELEIPILSEEDFLKLAGR